MRKTYDVIVIGGGHAGTEAAWAASSALGAAAKIALITMDPSRIGQMSCNPAIGGLGKGQMVREIDALGGIMGRAADATGIMFKMLNMSKGAAVRGPRCQNDKYAYPAEVQRLISTRANIEVIAATVDDIVVDQGKVVGVILSTNARIASPDPNVIETNLVNEKRARPVFSEIANTPAILNVPGKLIRTNAIVLTTGTFMRALMHTGENKTEGGRINEAAAVGISATLRKLGFELGRLKTGTPPRLARESIDWDSLDVQVGDAEPIPFSDLSPSALPNGRFPHLPQVECRVTHTTPEAHDLIRENLHRAPMFSGQIDAECGPRYCPSIEDKIVRFANRESHHVFLEPESLHTNEIYCNGISTSLPTDVQEQIVRLMPGCANAEILRWGYAVEYDMVWPHQIDSTCMTKSVDGLFLAGQINCTTGYEEAAAQGVIAGLNAARRVLSQEPVRIGRDQAYIGVMMDDLVTKTPREPYRMFTSRAEHRLHLRSDNSDERLTHLGRELALVDDIRWNVYKKRSNQLELIRNRFDRIIIDGKSLREIARRPSATLEEIATRLNVSCDIHLIERVVTEARYDGYIARQQAELRRQVENNDRTIPRWLEYERIPGLRSEAVETLCRFRPTTLGQAGRLAGVNPADVTLLAVVMRRGKLELTSTH